MSPSRRTVLLAPGLGLAGCIGDDDDDAADEDIDGGIPGPTINGIELRSSFPLVLRDPANDDRVADVHFHDDFAHWHRQPLEVPLDGSRTVEVELALPDGELLDIRKSGITIDAGIVTDTPPDLFDIEIEHELITFHGNEEGEGQVRFDIAGEQGQGWTTPELYVEVRQRE